MPTLSPTSRKVNSASPFSCASTHAASMISRPVASRRSATLSRLGTSNMIRSIRLRGLVVKRRTPAASRTSGHPPPQQGLTRLARPCRQAPTARPRLSPMATHKGPRARGPIRGSPLVTAFFVGLGLEVEGSTFVEGEFVDSFIAIPDSRTEIVMLRPHGGGTGIELSSFVRPRSRAPIARGDGNELGLRSVVFEVDDLQAAVDGLAA